MILSNHRNLLYWYCSLTEMILFQLFHRIISKNMTVHGTM